LDFFRVLFVEPRGGIEEGGTVSVCLGELFGELPYCGWGDLEYVRGEGVLLREDVRGEPLVCVWGNYLGNCPIVVGVT
jgi:hypothetical protein